MVWSTTASSSALSRERVHRASGVIAAAVEAPVDQVLDAAAQGLEAGGGGQGGGGHGQASRAPGQAGGDRQDQRWFHNVGSGGG
jgi:hypothetical protein